MIASLDDAIEYEKQEMAWKLKYEMIDGFPEKIAKHKRYIEWFTELQQRREADKLTRAELDEMIKEVRK